MALGAYQALSERELSVPHDISVVGFDDLPESRWAAPALTTVRQPLAEMAATALRLLVRMRAGEQPEGRVRSCPRVWWNGRVRGPWRVLSGRPPR